MLVTDRLMDRKEFISLVGMGAGAIALSRFLDSCKKKSEPAPSANTNTNTNTSTNTSVTACPGSTVSFTLDLTLPANSALNQNGGYIYQNGVIVARTNTGAYIAVAEFCTHQGCAVQYQLSSNRLFCPCHGSAFSTSGAVTHGPAMTALKQYTTSLDGNILTVCN